MDRVRFAIVILGIAVLLLLCFNPVFAGTWEELPVLPYAGYSNSNLRSGIGVNPYNLNEIFASVGYGAKYNGTSWIFSGDYASTAPYAYLNGVLYRAHYDVIQRWDGSSWVTITSPWPWSSYKDDSIKYVFMLPTGKIVAFGDVTIGSTGYRAWAFWNGTSWENADYGFNGLWVSAYAVDANGTAWIALTGGYNNYSNRFYYWNGTEWQYVDTLYLNSINPRAIVVTTTGTFYLIAFRQADAKLVIYQKLSNNTWQEITTTSFSVNEGKPVTAQATPDGGFWLTVENKLYRFVGTSLSYVYGWARSDGGALDIYYSHFAGDLYVLNGYMAPYPFARYRTSITLRTANVTQNSITVNFDYEGQPLAKGTLQLSTDGTNFLDNQNVSGNSAVVSQLQPGTSYWLRVYWVSPQGLKFYSNTIQITTVPPTPLTPSASVSRISWSNSVGRGRAVLTWAPVSQATGYAVWVFDGNTYRRFDVGNTTSWDSQVARIYPDPNWLATQPDNSISTDPFNHAGEGFDLQDNPNILYRKTVGTTYDNATNYWFRVSAYNSSGESPRSNAVIVTLPVATDQVPPTGSVSVISREGLKKTFNPEIKVTVNASDTLSGIRRIELSNDSVSYTKVYEAPLNPDNGTSVGHYANTFDWTVPLGAGTKVVYVRVTDAVGNARVFTDSIALAEDMLPPSVTLQINGGAESTTSPNVTLTLSVQDNASTTSQMQMRFSNDGNLWSPWEPFAQTKTWDLTASAYGGNTSPGIKKVYAQVCDQAQNVALAVAEIGYNPNPLAGTASIVGGSSGTWNGKAALFTASDAPTVSLNFPGATYVRFDPGTGMWGDWEPYASEKTVYLVKSSGAARLRVQVKDAYGVTSASQEFLVVVDPTPPVIQYLRGLGSATATRSLSMVFEVNATDNLPGQLYYQYRVNGGTTSSWLPLSGSTITVSGLTAGANNITVSVKDQAGNVASAGITVFKVE